MNEDIKAKRARAELGDSAYFTLHKWLRDKGYMNDPEIFITKEQMKEFNTEQLKEFKPSEDTENLWGQTREVFNK